jgi:mRNA-degrading endonuclease toxin of MazEF toxin-antitoxin module
MDKPFDLWNSKKKHLNHENRLFFHERQVWFCAFGINIGSEQDGKGVEFLRPVIVLRKFNARTFWGIPLTSKAKIRPNVVKHTDNMGRVSLALLEQLRLLDAKRLRYRVGTIPNDTFGEITKNLEAMIPQDFSNLCWKKAEESRSQSCSREPTA